MSDAVAAGRVVLVGGGPGSLDLLTLRALRELEQADVIVIGAGLSGLVAATEIADAGKRVERAQQTIRLLASVLAVERAPVVEGTTTESALLAAAMFALGTYAPAHPRLTALTWGAEDLAAAIADQLKLESVQGLSDDAEAARGGGGPVAAVVAGQDRIALLHRRGGEAGVA